MHTLINPIEFSLPIDPDTDIQNLSDITNIIYTQSVSQPTLTAGYLTAGFILEPFKVFRFKLKDGDDPALKVWIYNPSHVQVSIQVKAI